MGRASIGHRLAVVVAVTALACRSAPTGPDPATRDRVPLDGIAALPALDIVVPRFVHPTRLEGVPRVVYLFTGGSLRRGLLADIMIGANPHPGSGLDRIPPCRGKATRTSTGGHLTETCDEPRGRATTVHHADGDLVCRAVWRSDEPDRWPEVIAALDAACGTLRRR